MNTDQKLYRSEKDRKVFGVCGGLGQYFGVDPTIIRIIFVVFTLLEGIGLLLYILLAIFMPVAPEELDRPYDGTALIDIDRDKASTYLGVGLLLVGGVILLDNLNLPNLHWINLGTVIPTALILVGVWVLLQSRQSQG
jgi:phage shock protein PspC (stress-responsive transcriptional regulator)